MKVFAVIFLLALLTGCDNFGSITDSEYVNKAQGYLDKGEIKAATIELKNALTQNPENAQARLLLGNLYLDTGNMPGAEKELHKARELGVSDESVLPLLASAYLAQGKYEDVQNLPRLQSSAAAKAQAELLTSQAIASLSQGDTDKASESIAVALGIKPDLPYALYGQAIVLNSGKEDLENARKSLNQALEYDPEYALAWAMLGDMERQAGNLEQAVQAYSKAIESSSIDINYRVNRAIASIELKQYDAAQQDINNLKQRAPNHPGVNFAQGMLNYEQGKYPEAKESFDLVLRANGNHMPAVFYLGATNLKLKNEQLAESYLNRYITANPNNKSARKLLAAQELSQGDYQRVEELVRPVVDSDSDDVVALNLLSNALIAQGKAKEGSKLLQHASNLQPESAFAKVRLGAGLLMQEDQPDAVASLKSAIELDPESEQADILLVSNYISKREYGRAEQAAQEFISRQPDNPVAHNLLGMVYIGKNLPEQAKAAFSKAVELAPGYPAASQNLAGLALMESKPDEARKLYQQVLETHENHLQTLLKLSALEAGQGNLDAMKALLERAMSAHPEAIQPRVVLARDYLQANNPDKALEVMSGLAEKNPNDPNIMGVMGSILIANKNYAAAKSMLTRLIEAVPASAEAHYRLAQAYAGLNDQVKTEEELARALELAPGHSMARISQTRLQLRDGKFDEAEKNLVILKEIAADDPRVTALDAALKARTGKETEAYAIIEQRYQNNPTTQSLLDLARTRWAQGKQQEAVGVMAQWVANHPDDIAVRNVLADAYITLGRREDAIVQYEKSLQVSENNPQALNNLAWTLRKTDPERALAYAERAYSINPESSGIMDTLSVVLLANGELARAERMNMRALEKNPASSSLLFHKARILEAAGKQDEAVTLLMKILQDQQTFPERDEAEAMLARLGG